MSDRRAITAPENGKNSRFTSENQPKNRRGKSLLTAIKRITFQDQPFLYWHDIQVVDKETLQPVQVEKKTVNEDGIETTELVDLKVSVRLPVNNAEALAYHYNQRMMWSDKILTDFLDRVDGKPRQSQEGDQDGEEIFVSYANLEGEDEET